jgi:hypothetical protein
VSSPGTRPACGCRYTGTPGPSPEPERPAPYIDDAGQLRTSAGVVVDDSTAAAEVLRRLATTDHEAAKTLLDRLEQADPAMAGRVVAELGGQEG